MSIKCSNCGNAYPETGAPYRCTKCGGTYQLNWLPQFFKKDKGESNGIWSSLNPAFLNDADNLITLAEGNTPLLMDQIKIKNQTWDVYYKCEYLNPTGSFKDRGSAAMITFLKQR
ncbi:MAG: pyridoxal-phosphate dependent enzyme, partial [Anaerolineales bacterium]